MTETTGYQPGWIAYMRRKLKNHVPALAPAARARSLTLQTAQKAKQAKLELLVIVPLMAITVPKLADEILAGLAGVTREVEDGGPWPRRP